MRQRVSCPHVITAGHSGSNGRTTWQVHSGRKQLDTDNNVGENWKIEESVWIRGWDCFCKLVRMKVGVLRHWERNMCTCRMILSVLTTRNKITRLHSDDVLTYGSNVHKKSLLIDLVTLSFDLRNHSTTRCLKSIIPCRSSISELLHQRTQKQTNKNQKKWKKLIRRWQILAPVAKMLTRWCNGIRFLCDDVLSLLKKTRGN